MRPVLRLLCLIGVNFVPGGGFFLAGWSGPTTLVLYWWENLCGAILVAILLAVYRHATRGRADAPDDATFRKFRGEFLALMFVFTIVQGLFLAFLFWMAASDDQNTLLIDADQISHGLVGVAGFLIAGFLVDLFWLRDRSFAWIRGITRAEKGRLMVMQLTVILGGGGALGGFGSVRGFIAVFIFFKVTMDIVLWWWSRHETTAVRDTCESSSAS